MNQPYDDITSRLGYPLWWDEVAVPRYDPFHPSLCANIYATQAALVKIRCQNCGTPFEVAFSWSGMDRVKGSCDLATQIEQHALSYGDPPNVCCCPGGSTMTSDADRVLEFWERELLDEWKRNARYEVSVEED